jgi:hypothetical protein
MDGIAKNCPHSLSRENSFFSPPNPKKFGINVSCISLQLHYLLIRNVRWCRRVLKRIWQRWWKYSPLSHPLRTSSKSSLPSGHRGCCLFPKDTLWIWITIIWESSWFFYIFRDLNLSKRSWRRTGPENVRQNHKISKRGWIESKSRLC